MSTSQQSIASAGTLPAKSPHDPGGRVDPACTDFPTPGHPVLRIDGPERSGSPSAAVDTSRDSNLPAQAAQLELSVRSSDSLIRRDLRHDVPSRDQSLSTVSATPVDVSAFTASEESLLRRFLKRSLPPAYVDAVIRLVSRSRKEMVEELEECLNERTRQLHQAVNVIQNLVREKKQLENDAIHLEQTRSNLRKIHSTLRGVQHDLAGWRHKALTG